MHTRVCVPRNVHTHTYGQLIATYVGAVITVGKEELTGPRYIVRVPEFRPCARTRTPKKELKKKKGKITKKKKEENGIHESGPLDRVLYSCRCLRKLAEGAKSSPKGTLHAPLTRLDATDIFLNFPIRSFMPRINAYNFRDDYRASDALYTRDPYRSTAREARYPEIETE